MNGTGSCKKNRTELQALEHIMGDTSADPMITELLALEHIMGDASADPMRLSRALLRRITEGFCYEIGRGAFGVVYHVWLASSSLHCKWYIFTYLAIVILMLIPWAKQGVLENGDVAVKKLVNLHVLTEREYLDEITIIKKVKHKNIVRLIGYCSETQGELSEYDGENIMAKDKEKFLCFEYVPNGNIKHYLQQEKSHVDNWPLRYQMIRGICQGLYYLHGQNIIHLDLKPENVMLDARMEPKITDFGLSRCLDKGQSKMIAENRPGTLRYIAPETIDLGEISFKSDVYALGVIIIELLTGIDNISLQNWDESLYDTDCPRFRRCTEIARNCTDRAECNRPTIADIISDLYELESRIPPPSSINQVMRPTTFPWFEMVDVYPIELSFPFVPNQEMHCQLAVANKTNGGAFFAIRSEYLERYHCGKLDLGQYHYLLPACTKAITVYRQAVEELPLYPDKLEINVLITGLDKNQTLEKLSTLSLQCTPMDVTFGVAQRLGFQLHVEDLTAVVVVSEKDDRALVVDTTYTCWEEGAFHFDGMDVHPTEPWVLVVGYARDSIVYIWNWLTNEKIGEYRRSDEYSARNMVALFIAREQWAVMGNSDGSILVRMCPTLDHVTEFKAHPGKVTALAVHPTRPFLLSTSNEQVLKLWDWKHDWHCNIIFAVDASVRYMMFNPRNANAFITAHVNGIAMNWRLRNPQPITRLEMSAGQGRTMFTYIGDRHRVACIDGATVVIGDLHSLQEQKLGDLHGKHLPIFQSTAYIIAFICHPTRPILVTASIDGFIHIWDCITYRLKRTYVNLRKYPFDIGFTGSRRLVIVNGEGITAMDVDLE